MAAKTLPIGFAEVLNLASLGIATADLSFKNVGLSSSKYIAIREESKRSVAIVDTTTKNVLRLPIAVDSAIMNPVSKKVALRAGNDLQIYDLEVKSKIKTYVMNENVVFWKWLDPKTIAIVTSTENGGGSVFHWTIEGEATPQKIFERHQDQRPIQIINYRVSADGKWCLLNGITSGAAGVTGATQVFSTDLKASQPMMDAPTGCFASVTLDNRDKPSNLFCFCTREAEGPRLKIIEVGVAKDIAFTKVAALNYEAGDFPVHMLPDPTTGCIFIITRNGLLFLYELQSGKCIFANKASQNTMFSSIEHEKGGVMAVDNTGRVSHFYVDTSSIVSYICSTMSDLELGVQMAKRYDLPGAESIFKQQFTRLLQANNLEAALDLAVSSASLRTPETINTLRNIDGGKGLLSFFQKLLSKPSGKLNAVESVELAKLILPKGGAEHIKNWLKESKLEPTEELGDLLRVQNVSLGLSVYLRANVPEKVISCFLQLGAQETEKDKALEHFANILSYAQRVNFTPDYQLLLSQLIRVNSERAANFALLLISSPEGSKMNIEGIVDLFMTSGDVKSFTLVLVEYLKPRGDREEDAALQTRLFEVNLLQAPQVCDHLFDNPDFKFTHYDRLKIAQLCERAGLYQRALEHFTDLVDIKRVLMNSSMMNPEFLLEFFGRMTPENCLDCLSDLLKYNIAQNLRLVVEVAKKWNDYLTPSALISLFEEFKSYNGLFFYLGSFVNFTDDKEVVFKYVEAAVKLDQLKEVERICRDNNAYDPVEVKEFLLQQNLKDPRPLIHVCDRFDFVPELTRYLFSRNLYMFIEAYVQRMNPRSTPQVVGTLIDLNCQDDQIVKLLASVRPPVDARDFFEKLVDEVEKRNRLKLLKSFLEGRASEGSQDVHVHNGLAKIYVETNNNATSFLTNNKFYDSASVGAFCEARDPHLAFIAYKRANGACDDALVNVCNKNGFFKDLSRYLVERQNMDLWAQVLQETNEHRRQLIDQVVATALPESRIPEEVSTTVKAFMAANLPNELIELLERIILHGPADGEFATNKNLQNLLILTAIKADKKRVMDYIKRLNNYDGPDIAKIALSDQYQLYEEAFFIYKKFKKGAESIGVLLDYIHSIDRAVEFASYWDQPDVWGILGKAQLDSSMVKEAIQSFLKADDAQHYQGVIRAAKEQKLYDDLIVFLKMARPKTKDAIIDYEIIFCYAMTNRLADLEDFLTQSLAIKVAELTRAGDELFAAEHYQAARILYTHVNNNAKLAICLVRLRLFAEAVEAARKANNINTWKEVCFSCVSNKEFRLAQMCAMNIIVFMDHLLDLVKFYESNGFFAEVIAVLEQGINLDRAHQGMYTQLGILYAKYREEKLFEHIKLFWSKLNIPTLIGACRQNLHWNEAVFLYTHYDQYDNAIETMILHSSECWSHPLFKETIKQAGTEQYYKAIRFYIAEHPLLLNDLLIDLAGQLDHSRVVDILTQAQHIPLIEKYLLHVQRENIIPVNEALNALYVTSENFRALRQSIDSYNNFDQIALAQKLEGHELVEFRRISAHLYKMNKRYERSIELSKKDSLWGDAMETAAESKDAELAQQLLMFFVNNKQNECFAACLYTCYALIRPDLVLELAWRNNLMNFAMPFMIQTMKEFDEKLNTLYSKIDEKEKAENDAKEKEKREQEEKNAHVAAAQLSSVAPIFTGPPTLALMPPQQMNMGAAYAQALVPVGPMGQMPQQQMGFAPLPPLGMNMPNQGYGF